MTKPRLLDLFCGAGGAAVGYHRAGFEVVGVDICPQPHYPFEFHQADALTYPLEGFDAIHASPPCQAYSSMSACIPGLSEAYPDLIGQTRERLGSAGVPYVIENVGGGRRLLRDPLMLCGAMFDLDLYRHRYFEANFPWSMILHPGHGIRGNRAGRWSPGTIISVAGHNTALAECKRAMGIDWMTGDELSEAIPPAYTEWIGRALLARLEVAP